MIGTSRVTFTALLPQIGGESGMIVDPEWTVIEPHADMLWKLGYGYSAVSLGLDDDYDSAREMLRDWGWSAAEQEPSWW